MVTVQKIRYSDCDPQGIVFNGNYGRYWDDAITDWWEELGLDQPGLDMVAARIEIDFRIPARLGDFIETEVAAEKVGNTSLTIGLITRRQSDRAVMAEGREVVVMIDATTMTPIPVPDRIREVLAVESSSAG